MTEKTLAEIAKHFTDSKGKLEKRIAAAKAPLMAHLKQLGVYKVTVEYGGSGDEGNIDDLVAYAAPGLLQTSIPHDAKTAIEAIIWDVIEAEHGGFGDGEGGGGEFTIDVEADKITYENWYLEVVRAGETKVEF